MLPRVKWKNKMSEEAYKEYRLKVRQYWEQYKRDGYKISDIESRLLIISEDDFFNDSKYDISFK